MWQKLKQRTQRKKASNKAKVKRCAIKTSWPYFKSAPRHKPALSTLKIYFCFCPLLLDPLPPASLEFDRALLVRHTVLFPSFPFTTLPSSASQCILEPIYTPFAPYDPRAGLLGAHPGGQLSAACRFSHSVTWPRWPNYRTLANSFSTIPTHAKICIKETRSLNWAIRPGRGFFSLRFWTHTQAKISAYTKKV